MINVKEKELRFRGELADEVYDKGMIRYYIEGESTTNFWLENYDSDKLYEIEVHYHGIVFYYSINCPYRSNIDNIRFMDDFMMEYVKTIDKFINGEYEAKKAGYNISYTIQEDGELDKQTLYCRLITDKPEKVSISKSSIIYEYKTFPTYIVEFKRLLTDAVNDLYFHVPAGGFKEDIHNMEPIDIVNHPGHYETGKFECIEVMQEALGIDAVKDFCICNAFKYLYRHKRKNGLEDIKKAKWYIDKFLELSEENKDGKEKEE